jgi:hypothetical protein
MEKKKAKPWDGEKKSVGLAGEEDARATGRQPIS